jgi:tocopherol O-methyltransferase
MSLYLLPKLRTELGKDQRKMYTSEDVIGWYERKSESILRKYGPGPRVHFHAGIIGDDITPATDYNGIRRQLVKSQEDMLTKAAQFWRLDLNSHSHILDAGCGFGGGSLFWAQEYGMCVYALTNTPGHLNQINQFVIQAGVTKQVTPLLGDAHEIPGNQIFDAVVALESSCYFDRAKWFQHLATRIREGGNVFIEDVFVENEEIREPFDNYWFTRIGTVDEYVSTSEKAGFKFDGLLDVTSQSARFWEFSIIFSRYMLSSKLSSEKEKERLKHSIDWQTHQLQEWQGGGIKCALLRFTRL